MCWYFGISLYICMLYGGSRESAVDAKTYLTEDFDTRHQAMMRSPVCCSWNMEYISRELLLIIQRSVCT